MTPASPIPAAAFVLVAVLVLVAVFDAGPGITGLGWSGRRR